MRAAHRIFMSNAKTLCRENASSDCTIIVYSIDGRGGQRPIGTTHVMNSFT
jgi:hypothetical protein